VEILTIDNVSYSYSNDFKAVDSVSMNVKEGDFWAILGANGSGKSTLVNMASGIIKPQGGKIKLLEKDIGNFSPKEIARKISFVPQNIHVDFPFSCLQIVLMGRYSHLTGIGIENSNDLAIADEALSLTGTIHLKDRMIHQLSGGERQRIFIAQAIAAQPRLFILDEPVSALDIRYKVKILDLLEFLNREKGITIITILHDLNMASLYARKILLLKNGKVAGAGTPDKILTPEKIQEVYEIPVEIIRCMDGDRRIIIPAKFTDNAKKMDV